MTFLKNLKFVNLEYNFKNLNEYHLNRKTQEYILVKESLFDSFRSNNKKEIINKDSEPEDFCFNINELLYVWKKYILKQNSGDFIIKINSFNNIKNSGDFIKAIEYQMMLLKYLNNFNEYYFDNLKQLITKINHNSSNADKIIENFKHSLNIKHSEFIKYFKNNKTDNYFDSYFVVKLNITENKFIDSLHFTYNKHTLTEISFDKNTIIKTIDLLVKFNKLLNEFITEWDIDGSIKSADKFFKQNILTKYTEINNKNHIGKILLDIHKTIQNNSQNLINTYINLFYYLIQNGNKL